MSAASALFRACCLGFAGAIATVAVAAARDHDPAPLPVLLLTPSPAPASPSPTPTAYMTLPASGAVFALSLGADAPTNARITIEIAKALRPKLGGTWVIPAPSWSLADYYAQCKLDPHTLGAVVALPVASRNASEGYLLLNRSWTQVDLILAAFDCREWQSRPTPAPTPSSAPSPATLPIPKSAAEPTPAPSPTPPRNAVTAYVTTVQSGIGSRNVANLLPLAALFTALQATRATSQETKGSTASYTTPGPTTAPGTAYTSQSTQSTVTTKNPNSELTIVGAQLFTQLSGNNVNIGSNSSADAQTAKAVERAIASLVDELMKSGTISERRPPCDAVSNSPLLCWIKSTPAPVDSSPPLPR